MEIVKPDKKGIEKAVFVLKKGGTVIYPTDTAYAIGCDVENKKALQRIFKIKKREKNKPLAAIVSSRQMASRYCFISSKEKELINKFMPGAVTLIARKKKNVPDLFNKEGFGFRIPENKIALTLSRKLKHPVVSTSANISGEKEVYSPEFIKIKADILIDAGKLKKRKTSTIIQLINGNLKIIRKGAVKIKYAKD